MASSFNSKTKIELEIDGINVTIDGIGMNVVKAMERIAEKSMKLDQKTAKNSSENPEEVMKNAEEMAELCREFLAVILDEDAYEKLVVDRVEDVPYLIDITTFILNEIKKSKEERLLKLVQLSNQRLL